MENRTDRLTILVDPRKKALFEDICNELDLTPSQVIRQFMRDYIVRHAGDREIPAWIKSSATKFHDPVGV
jgi:antitoxin component of RelBE/YafQ-DinJ toxin-antitoxin module